MEITSHMHQSRLFVILVLALLIVLSSCTGNASSDSEVRQLLESDRLVPVDTIAIQETDEDYIGNYDVLHVANTPFRMYVPDIQRGRIAVLRNVSLITVV